MTMYLVMDAPGYYGDYAYAYTNHASLRDAIRAAAGAKNVVVVESDDDEPGEYAHPRPIHRERAQKYKIVWPVAIQIERAQTEKMSAAERRDEEKMAAKYGRGSAQYDAAMSHPLSQRN